MVKMTEQQDIMPKHQQNGSSKKWLVMGLVFALIAGAAWWYKDYFLGQLESTQPKIAESKRGIGMSSTEVIPVKVDTAFKGSFVQYVKALGTINAYNTVNIVSRVQGELVKVLFTEGQEVKEGDLLAVVDPRPYEAALEQAKGTFRQDQAQLRNAHSELIRYQTLIKQDSIAKQTYDSQLALVRQYQGAVLSSQAQVKDAELNLEFTQIKAPISGRLGIRQIDIGNYIKVGDTTPLVSITQVQPISATFTLPETQLPEVARRLADGQSLVVEAWSSNNTQLLATGVVETLDNQINTTTGTILVKARFENKDNILFPNQFVNIKLKLATLDDALIIPTDAVQYGNKGTFVYVVNDGKVHLRYITLGSSDADKTVVLSGLETGDKVVLEGTDRLRENTRVEVIGSVSDLSDKTIKEQQTAETTPVSEK